ncbi:TIGR03643 family protein [Rhodopirellula europaea]|uniref:TIGR03643 family protein n=1 Tax=Rhodopirellula europaea TaxID=1263866 RepID=UPI0028F44D4F|nr:TIGR03643 family protein [Rhodopirellula europaea]
MLISSLVFSCGRIGDPTQKVLSKLLNKRSKVKRESQKLSRSEIDRVIMMFWEDRTSFDAIRTQFSLSHGDVIELMRKEMKPSSFCMWRRRTARRLTKTRRRF